MSISATGARRPLQSKPRANPFLKRASSSFSDYARQKPSPSEPVAKKAKVAHDDDGDDALPHGPIVASLKTRSKPKDVISIMSDVKQDMFDCIPERSAGMSSTRIAEVLNYRRSLAPIVSIAHIHANSLSSTAADREIATLLQQGTLRRITILGRGRGGSPVGDCLILTADWESAVRASAVTAELQETYIDQLRSHPASGTITASKFTVEQVAQLVNAGFMTSTSALSLTNIDTPSRSGAFSLDNRTSVAKAGTTAAAGTHEAVGGREALLLHGGGTGGLSKSSDKKASGNLTFSVPGTGAYLRLLTEARSHLTQLITKSSPRHKEGLKEMLAERWEGNTPGEDAASRGKRARGEWTGVLPGKTKKWKSFYGIRFEWVLEECIGTGLVECFDTRSVGLGVRLLR